MARKRLDARIDGWAHIDFFGGKSMYLPMAASCRGCDRPIEIDGRKWDTGRVECDDDEEPSGGGG